MIDEPAQDSEPAPVSAPVNDRRAHPRQRVRSLAYVHLGESNGGIVLNISEGGIAVQAAQALDSGEGTLAMRIDIPHSRKRLEVNGEIAWIGESRKEAGLRFVDLSEIALKRIRSWMAREESPGTATDETEEDVETPAIQAAETRAEVVAAAENFTDRGERLEDAEDFEAAETGERDEIEEPVEDVADAADFDPAAAVKFAEAPDDEPVTVAADDKPTTAAPSRVRPSISGSEKQKEPITSGPAAHSEEDLAPMIAPGFEKNPQIPQSPYTPISGSHGAPAFAAAAPPPAPPRFGGADLAAPLFPQPRVFAEPVPTDGGWKSFRVQLQSGWFLAVLMLLLVTISFIAGVAVRRGALNAVMGDAEDIVQPKSAPAPSSGIPPANAAPNPSVAAAAAASVPAKPLQIEIVDLENHRWTIPAASGANRGDAGAARQTQPNDTTAPDRAASTAKSAPQSVPNVPSQSSTQATPPSASTAAAKPGEPLMLNLPETPLSASGSVAISATTMVPVPAGDAPSAQHARNLQIGELVTMVEPEYPPDARQARLEGTVKLHVGIAANGEVESFRAISGPDSLAHAAMLAVREWRYRPTLLNGKPVATQEDVTFVFRLPN